MDQLDQLDQLDQVPDGLDDQALIIFDPENARDHPERNRELIRESLRRVGGFRSIAIDGEGVIRAGNGVWREAQDLGFRLRIVDAGPDEIIGVRRPDLTGTDARLAAIYDNRTGETSLWNLDTLEELDAYLNFAEHTSLWTPEEWTTLFDPDSASEEPPGYVLPDDAEDQGPARLSGRGTVGLQERTNHDEKYPLPIVLTRQEYEAWIGIKAQAGACHGKPITDRTLFVQLTRWIASDLDLLPAIMTDDDDDDEV
jgi:hypothetical protein